MIVTFAICFCFQSALLITRKHFFPHQISKIGDLECFKVTVQFERCFRLMEHISVISCRNPINLHITEKLIKFSKSLFNLYLIISNK